MKRRVEKRTHHWAFVHRRTPRTHARTHTRTHTHTRLAPYLQRPLLSRGQTSPGQLARLVEREAALAGVPLKRVSPSIVPLFQALFSFSLHFGKPQASGPATSHIAASLSWSLSYQTETFSFLPPPRPFSTGFFF